MLLLLLPCAAAEAVPCKQGAATYAELNPVSQECMIEAYVGNVCNVCSLLAGPRAVVGEGCISLEIHTH